MTTTDFKTTHDLPFLSRHWDRPWNLNGWQEFSIGTCHGLWVATKDTYDILTVLNMELNNGHFTDVLEWFENSCKRDKKSLRILETWNERLAKHLVEKRGFTYQSEDNLIKRFSL